MATTSSNARALVEAIVAPDDGTIPCRLITDGHHRGTLFAWLGDEWAVTDLENRQCLGTFGRLAVVSVDMDDAEAAETGLNQTAIGFDFDGAGEWIVDADDLDGLRDTYGAALVVLWEQDETTK